MDYNTVSHCCATNDISVPAARDRLGNLKMLTVLLTPPGSSMWKARLMRRAATVWVILRGLSQRSRARVRRFISNAVRAFSFFMGAMSSQITGRSCMV